jgi:uncharacterized protein YraI
LRDIALLSTAIAAGRYGVAMLHTTGYPLNSWEAQSVLLVPLGDVTLTNTGQESVTVDTLSIAITSAEGANVRTGTSTEFRILTALFEGDFIKATGRLADDSWVRVQLPEGRTGWLSTSALDADLVDLAVVDYDTPEPELLYTPYSSFSLQTATGDNRCGQVWESGLLLQAPEENPVRIRINDQLLLVAGTIFLQTPLDTAFDVFVIEGSVQVGDVDVVEGYQATVATTTDDSGNIAQPIVKTYDFARLAYLPTEILPRYTYIGIDITTIITPAPNIDRSPIIDMLVTDPCVLTTGPGGANLRSGPGANFPIRGVLDFRQTARPSGRATASDGALWWELAQNVWITGSVVVTGGDCTNVPQSQRIPNPLPTATPEN